MRPRQPACPSVEPAVELIADLPLPPAAAPPRRAWNSLFANPLLSTASLKRAALDGLADSDELGLVDIENWTPL